MNFVRVFLVAVLFASYTNLIAQNIPGNQSETNLLKINVPVERQLKAQESHVYMLQLKAGDFLRAAVDQRGIDVVVRVFAPNGNKLIEVDSPNGKNGIEPVEIQVKADGIYKIEVASLDKNSLPGQYEIKVNEILSAAEYTKVLSDKRTAQQQVINWISENAIPIKTIEAGHGFRDLHPLKNILKNVQIVGLGEETHGTREFSQFKHRMVEFLVREMGYRVFMMELDYAACLQINDYVTGKTSERTNIILKPWDTEEFLAMIDWMRAFNANVPADKKIKFAGFDGQDRVTGADRVLDYLKKAAPERASLTEELFKDKTHPVRIADKEKAIELQNKYVELFMFFEQNKMNLINKSSVSEYEQIYEIVRAMTQTGAMYAPDISNNESLVRRDSYMATNLKRIIDREPAGTKFIVWAHNGHIENSTTGFPRLGSYLHQFYGSKYYALGFSFNQGEFQAWDAEIASSQRKFVIKPFTVSAAPEDSLDWYLAQTKKDEFIIDFHSTINGENLSKWFNTPHSMRSIGANYSARGGGGGSDRVTPNKEFDGIFFIDTTTRAHPSKAMKERYKE